MMAPGLMASVPADARDAVGMVVAVAHQVELARGGDGAGDAVVVVHRYAPALKLPAKQLAMNPHMLVLPRVGADAVEIAIVVAKYHVDGAGGSRVPIGGR